MAEPLQTSSVRSIPVTAPLPVGRDVGPPLQYIKSRIVHTPIGNMAQQLRSAWAMLEGLRTPELRAIRSEPFYVEAACRKLLTAESNTIDIGAHLGSQLSRFVALAPRGRHVAFEPVPYKARWLRAKFPSVDVRETALHNTTGRSSFFVNVSRPGYSGLMSHAVAGDVMQEIHVEQRRLDDVIDQRHKVDLIKVDVEGAELFSLQGATELLLRCRPILMFESTATGLDAWSLAPEQLYDLLSGLGYRIFVPRAFVERGLPLQRAQFAAAHQYPFAAFNFIARIS